MVACNSVLIWSLISVCGREVAKGLMKYQPDIIISVHPLMQHVPLHILRAKGLLQKIVFTTVVTDLSTCHPTWLSICCFCCFSGTSLLEFWYLTSVWLGSISLWRDVIAHQQMYQRGQWKLGSSPHRLRFMAFLYGLLLWSLLDRRLVIILVDYLPISLGLLAAWCINIAPVLNSFNLRNMAFILKLCFCLCKLEIEVRNDIEQVP
jgi:hypothetical protein